MSWIKTANVGDKVVCIKDDWKNEWYPNTPCAGPKSGDVVTIADIVPLRDTVFLALFEDIQGDYYEADGFRPVQPRKTDISVFTDMLNTAPVKETEEA